MELLTVELEQLPLNKGLSLCIRWCQMSCVGRGICQGHSYAGWPRRHWKGNLSLARLQTGGENKILFFFKLFFFSLGFP